jgi:ABC-2 type transport system permease protein
VVNAPVIARRELRSYFLSPVAYVVLAAFAVAQGIGFAIVLADAPAAGQAAGAGVLLDLREALVRLFGLPFHLLVLTVPILTMRLLSEESRTGTLETLMTTPTGEAEVTIGKFVGALLFAVVLFVPLGLQVAVLGTLGTLDVGALLAGVLGLLLVTAQFVALGLFCSSMTRAQIVSGIVTLVVLLALQSAQFMARAVPPRVGAVLRYLAPLTHYVNFTKGVVDTRDLAYFVLTTFALLFLTVRSLQLRKWR